MTTPNINTHTPNDPHVALTAATGKKNTLTPKAKSTSKTTAELVTEDATAGLEAATAALHSVMMGEMAAAGEAAAVSPQALLIYSDKFTLISDAFKPEFVKGIELPKIIMKKVREDQQAVEEKSSIMVYLNVTMDNIRSGCFKQLYKAARKGPIKLELQWNDEEPEAEDKASAKTASSSKKKSAPVEEKDPLSIWKFEGARIQALDFGTAVCKRPDINRILIEVTFESVEIDGISL